MDFRLTADQLTVQALAKDTFGRRADPQRLADIERTADHFDHELWAELADAGVLGLALPSAHGGSDLGLTELALVLREQGRVLALVPVWESVVLGALPIMAFGSEKQQEQWLPKIGDGTAVFTGALETLGFGVRGGAVVRATGTDDSWTLTGSVPSVPAGHLADAIVVPALTESGATELFLVTTDSVGLERERHQRTDRGSAVDLVLDRVSAQRLSNDKHGEADKLQWLLERAWVGLAAIQIGVSQESVRRCAEFLSERHQFGVPLATFQAAAHQAANCHIDTEAMEVTLWDAVWRLDSALPIEAAAYIAKWWAADAGDRVARSVQHLHGGLGSDITYPIHRYLLWSTQLANTLGSASWHLHQIGLHLAGDN